MKTTARHQLISSALPWPVYGDVPSASGPGLSYEQEGVLNLFGIFGSTLRRRGWRRSASEVQVNVATNGYEAGLDVCLDLGRSFIVAWTGGVRPIDDGFVVFGRRSGSC